MLKILHVGKVSNRTKKIKALKGGLKLWNKEHFRNLQSALVKNLKLVHDLGMKAEQSVLTGGEVLERREGMGKIIVLKRKIQSLAYQKARINWFRHGEEKSKLFHACINRGRRNTEIKRIYEGESWVPELAETKRLLRIISKTSFHVSVAIGHY